jgi:diguanylate cyclase (GGDEF)-like protein
MAPRPGRAGRRAAAAALLLLLVTLATGITLSPLVPVLSAALAVLLRYDERRAVLAAPAAAVVVLIMVQSLAGDVGARHVLIAVAALLAAYAGLLWRREAKRAARRLATLDDVLVHAERTRTAHAPSPVEELADLEAALAAAAERIGARAILIWDVDGYRGVARPRAGSAGRPLVTVHLSGDTLGWAWEQGMRLRVPHTPRWTEAGMQVIAERLRRHGDRGELMTCVFEPGRVPDAELPLEETAIYVRGMLALQEARAGAHSAQRRLDTLSAGLRLMPGELELETLAADLCRTAMALTDGTGAAIGAWTGEQGTVLAVAGDDGGPRVHDTFVPPASELGLAIRADAMIVREAAGWSLGRTCLVHPDERWSTRPRALAALPLHLSGTTIGVLAVWTSRDAALNPEALELLHSLSPYTALHLGHARAFDRLRESSERDPLTQLYNRRAFDRIFAGEATRFERYGRPLALLMLDLDHFKDVNDRHGHEAGDEVLRHAARAAAGCIREIDVAARFGGEEFVVLLPETAPAAALEVADRIRAAVAASHVSWAAQEIAVTVSIGVAACPGQVATPADLMAAADAALYQAKAAGRNRVASAEPVRAR